MQLEALYSHGQLSFTQPVKLKHDNLRLIVNVPDEEIEADSNPFNLPQEVIDRANATRARFDAIRNAPLPTDQELPEITEKQFERIEAFAMREEIKGLR